MKEMKQWFLRFLTRKVYAQLQEAAGSGAVKPSDATMEHAQKLARQLLEE